MDSMKELIYVGDPMCSWCYGFAPIKQQLEEQCEGRAIPLYVAGGLHVDWTDPWDETYRIFLREHWTEIGGRSGQPFKFDILSRTDFVYNTGASCRAAVTAREMEGDAVSLNFFTRLQGAFYAENQDITDDDTLIRLAGEFGLDLDKFIKLFKSEEMKNKAVRDYQHARNLGVTGFPTVVLKDSSGYAYLTVGYRDYTYLEPLVEAWLAGQLVNPKSI